MKQLRVVPVFLAALIILASNAAPVFARPFFPVTGSVKGASAIHVPVLLFHYVRRLPVDDSLGAKLSVDPEQFRRQIEYLLSHDYTPISPDLLYTALQSRVLLPKNAVILTFDDGTEDFITTVFPILTSYGIPATVYVIPAFIGSSGYLSWQQLHDVSASPMITVGGHGLNHVPLTSLPRDVARRQLILTKNFLVTVTGQPIRTFAYPNGQYNNDIAAMADEAGYTTAFTTVAGTEQSIDGRLELPRVHAGSSVASLIRALAR